MKEALLNRKLYHSQIKVEIVLDDNIPNTNYFYNTVDQYRRTGIVIHPEPNKMMHYKFMVIDSEKTLIGSYNYSANARTNLECIYIFQDLAFSAIYTRVFLSISNPMHVDDNIKLLVKYPDFARKSLSMYYPFLPAQFQAHKPLLVSGNCFTYDNGSRDSLEYEPGYLFNSSVTLPDSSHPVLPKPYSKKDILRWSHNDGELAIIDSFATLPEQWDRINDALEDHAEWLKSYYKRLIESTHTTGKIERLIVDGVDIVMEDRLWEDNFAPFINQGHLTAIFESISLYQTPPLTDLRGL